MSKTSGHRGGGGGGGKLRQVGFVRFKHIPAHCWWMLIPPGGRKRKGARRGK